MLIMAALLLTVQILCVGLFALAWHSYPIEPVALKSDGFFVWCSVAAIIFIVDCLFVWLCDAGLLARRAALVKLDVDSQTAVLTRELADKKTQLKNAEARSLGFGVCLTIANQRLTASDKQPVMLNGTNSRPDMVGLSQDESLQVNKLLEPPT